MTRITTPLLTRQESVFDVPVPSSVSGSPSPRTVMTNTSQSCSAALDQANTATSTLAGVQCHLAPPSPGIRGWSHTDIWPIFANQSFLTNRRR